MVYFRRVGRCHGRLLVAACLGLSALSAVATPARADATVVVDASRATSFCGSNCDDVSTLQDIFQDANVFADASYDAMDGIIADLKMRRVRLLQMDVYCDIDSNGQTFGYTFNGAFNSPVSTTNPNLNDCFPLAWTLDWAFKNHLSPHVPVATFMPPSFVQYVEGVNGGGETLKTVPWPTGNGTQLDRYKAYAQALVHYIVQKSVDAGAPSVVFEISNELDIADSAPVGFDPGNMSKATLLPLGPYGRFLWWIDPNSYSMLQWSGAQTYPYSMTGLGYPYDGDARRLDHGVSPVHQIFAGAITNEINSNPKLQGSNPALKIILAGPALAGYYFVFPQNNVPTLEEDFLDQMLKPAQSGCTSNPTCDGTLNARLDGFSFHYYGNARFPAYPGQSSVPLETITNTVKAKLVNLGQSQVPLFLSEWGPNSANSDMNYSEKGAAWAANFLLEALRAGVQMGSYLILDDGVAGTSAGDPGSYAWGEASLLGKVIHSDNTVSYYPKPAANVFKMFAMMTGTSRPATVTPLGSSNIGAFATSDTSSAHVVVWNYDPTVVFGPNPEASENVAVSIGNLPFSGAVTVQRYLVDAATSNFFAFVGNPQENIPGDPTRNPNLQMVEQYQATVSNGQLQLPQNGQTTTTLGTGVTYWRVTWTPPSGG